MLTSDLNFKAHVYFHNYILNAVCFFLHTKIKSKSFERKIEIHIESNFHSVPPIDVRRFQSLQCKNNPKMRVLM